MRQRRASARCFDDRALGSVKGPASLQNFAYEPYDLHRESIILGGIALADRLLVCFLAAASTALVTAPWSAPGGSFVATALALAPSLALVAVGFAPLRSLAEGLARKRVDRAAALAIWLLRDLILVGVYLVCDRVADAPDGAHAIACDALVVVSASALTFALLRRLMGRRTVALVTVVAGLMLTGAVETAVLDAVVLPREHSLVHQLLLVGALLAFVAGWTLASRAFPMLGRMVAAAALVPLALSTVAFVRAPSPWPALMATHSPHQRLISLARRALDRDGDGFSAALGGGDCDDDDATAFPLSTTGRDCLAWTPSLPPAASRAPTVVAPAPSPPPTAVVLITIDAFRCGFGAGPAPLDAACPTLTRMAQQGRARLDAHSNFPVTARSITALHSGDLFANPERPVPRPQLASFYRQHGFATTAIVTHRYTLADRSVRDAFDVVDESLAKAASAPSGVTSERVTDRVLDQLASTSTPQLVWAHYFDPHAPYVSDDGDPFTDDDLAAYVHEVQRTDRAIGRLLETLARRPDADRVLVFVTADHGEAFGEHGVRHHGHDLHEEVMRVPMIAWTAGPNHRALGDEHLPASTVQVAPYLDRLLAPEPAPDDQTVFARIHTDGDDQMAVIEGGRKLIYHRTLAYTELYDLDVDPDETIDRAASDPEGVRQLGRTLATFVRALSSRKQHDLRLLTAAHVSQR